MTASLSRWLFSTALTRTFLSCTLVRRAQTSYVSLLFVQQFDTLFYSIVQEPHCNRRISTELQIERWRCSWLHGGAATEPRHHYAIGNCMYWVLLWDTRIFCCCMPRYLRSCYYAVFGPYMGMQTFPGPLLYTYMPSAAGSCKLIRFVECIHTVTIIMSRAVL